MFRFWSFPITPTNSKRQRRFSVCLKAPSFTTSPMTPPPWCLFLMLPVWCLDILFHPLWCCQLRQRFFWIPYACVSSCLGFRHEQTHSHPVGHGGLNGACTGAAEHSRALNGDVWKPVWTSSDTSPQWAPMGENGTTYFMRFSFFCCVIFMENMFKY